MSESSKKLLSMLLVIGAQSPERALGARELAQKVEGELGMVESELRSLIQSGYVATTGGPGAEGYYLTGTGVITASSTYS